MAKNNGLEMDVVETLINEGVETLGLRIEHKAAWLGLYGPNGHVMYFAKQKRCRRIDLSGFGKNFVGTIPLESPNGRVQAHVDLNHENVISHLLMLMALMTTLPKEERKRSFSPKAVAPSRPDSGPVATLPDSLKEDRLALIRRTAAQLGVTVSDSVK